MTARTGVGQGREWLRRIGVFGLVGSVATAIQYAILILGVELLALRPAVASGIGFVVSATVNYYLNHRLTFRSSRPHLSAASRFIVVAGVGLLLNVAAMELLTVRWRVPYLLGQITATALVITWAFCGSAFWTFAHRVER